MVVLSCKTANVKICRSIRQKNLCQREKIKARPNKLLCSDVPAVLSSALTQPRKCDVFYLIAEGVESEYHYKLLC